MYYITDYTYGYGNTSADVTVEKVLETYGMKDAKPVSTPMQANEQVGASDGKVRSFNFREAIGSLLYLANKTRPDLSYAVENAVDVLKIHRVRI